MIYGRQNTIHSEIKAGLKPGNVKTVLIIKIALAMVCITGMATKKMCWFVIMKKY